MCADWFAEEEEVEEFQTDGMALDVKTAHVSIGADDRYRGRTVAPTLEYP